MNTHLHLTTIGVIGLGYVGLPLAVALAERYNVTGFDINEKRVQELKKNQDTTREISYETLESSRLQVTYCQDDIKGKDVYIVTVPTPVTSTNKPDLSILKQACKTLAEIIEKGAIIVFESTVYPGVTEDICGPEIEKYTSLKSGKDFFLGYSPERINPGDKHHTIDKITKIVAAQTDETARLLAEIYGGINTGNIHIAPNIKTAEAAKVIENAQRDINIAFVNEISIVFRKLGLNTYDVLEAAGTKWNFLPFQPGLVGGHCIGVDPYYMSHCAQSLGHNPEIILSGRRINDSMGKILAYEISDKILDLHQYGFKANILILGLTFKENIPDLRNSRVIDLINGLEARGHHIDVCDMHAQPDIAEKYYNLEIYTRLPQNHQYDCVIAAVPHKEFKILEKKDILNLLTENGLVADLKGVWRPYFAEDKNIHYWQI